MKYILIAVAVFIVLFFVIPSSIPKDSYSITTMSNLYKPSPTGTLYMSYAEAKSICNGISNCTGVWERDGLLLNYPNKRVYEIAYNDDFVITPIGTTIYYKKVKNG